MATKKKVSMYQLRARREEILDTARRRGADEVRIFGSVASDSGDEQSDVDVLVRMAPGRSLVDLSGLRLDLIELLGCSVDVVTEAGLRSRIRDEVLRTAQPL